MQMTLANLLKPQLRSDWSDTSYQSVLQSQRVVTLKRNAVSTPGMWIFGEPLLGNSFINSPVLSSNSLRPKLWEAGIVKLGHLLKTPRPPACAASGPNGCCSGWWNKCVLPCQRPSGCSLWTPLTSVFFSLLDCLSSCGTMAGCGWPVVSEDLYTDIL